MSFRTLHYLYCDGESCPYDGAPLTISPGANWSKEDIRANAKMKGWTHVRGKDYCESCAKPEPRRAKPNASGGYPVEDENDA